MLRKKHIVLLTLAAVTGIVIVYHGLRAQYGHQADESITIQIHRPKDTVYVQPSSSQSDTVYVHDTVFIPHRAPDSSFMGKYEGENMPFIIRSNGVDLLVNDRTWNVNLKDKKYRTRASGYIHSRQPDGNYTDLPVLIEEENDYDTLSRKLTGAYNPVILASQENDKLPDTLHNTPDTAIANFYWNNFRYVSLPHTVNKDGMNFKVYDRTVIPELLRDTVFVTMTLNGIVQTGQFPGDSVTVAETRPMKPVMY